MKEKSSYEITHPPGDRALVVGPIADGPVIVDTYLGRVKVDWDPDANVTALGSLKLWLAITRAAAILRWAVPRASTHLASLGPPSSHPTLNPNAVNRKPARIPRVPKTCRTLSI